MHPGMLPTKQSIATSRYPQSQKKYTNQEADGEQEAGAGSQGARPGKPR